MLTDRLEQWLSGSWNNAPGGMVGGLPIQDGGKVAGTDVLVVLGAKLVVVMVDLAFGADTDAAEVHPHSASRTMIPLQSRIR